MTRRTRSDLRGKGSDDAPFYPVGSDIGIVVTLYSNRGFYYNAPEIIIYDNSDLGMKLISVWNSCHRY